VSTAIAGFENHEASAFARLPSVVAWVVTIAPRRIAARFGLLRQFWHPALFVFAVYLIVFSSWFY
jgi:hypothetical protein